MHAEILAIGDEITSGQLLDTNSQWLSQRLEELGVRVLFHSTVGDELEPCADVFRRAIARADVVVATGGLGPTADDLTREALARATGRELQLDRDALEQIHAMFARRKRPMPSQNELQAMFPAGSRVIRNPHGTAPGIDLDVPRSGQSPCRVFCLPGVPAEMVEMWDDSLGAAIRGLGAGRRIVRRRINCFGAGESQIESMLPDLIRRGRRPTVGINASKTAIILRIAAEGATEAECAAAIEPTVATIRQCLGTLVFGEEDDELQHVVVRLLRGRKQTLATVEWGTSGLVAEWLGSIDAVSDAYRGGLVVTDQAALHKLDWLGSVGPNADAAASPEMVSAMAIGCRQRFGVDFGLAVGPFPSPASIEGEPQPVLLALASADGVLQQKNIPFAGHPATLRIYTAKHALNLARLAMLPAR
jgi:nicotinamide-nucleotide amidase